MYFEKIIYEIQLIGLVDNGQKFRYFIALLYIYIYIFAAKLALNI